MRKPKERILYNSYYDEEREKYAKEWLIENSGDENYEPTEDEIQNEYYQSVDRDFDDFEINFKDYFNTHTCLLVGSIGRWNGNFQGGYYINKFTDLYRCWEDCNYIKIYDENGHLYIQCSHHDGTNYFEIKELTDKGREYVDNHYYDDDRKVHEMIMKYSKYAVLPHLVHKEFGCPKIEYEK